MKGLLPLFLGLFGTFAFSWVGLILIPNFQIGHLDPQMDEEGTDVYPMPQSGMVERGRHVFAANGCAYCHSEQLRSDYAASDIDRTRDLGPTPRPKWGERRSAPRDYIFARPVLLGKMRMGPDLANIGKAAPAEEESPAPAPGGNPAAVPAQPPGASTAPSPAAASPAPPNAASPAPKTSAATTANPPPAASAVPASPNAASPTPKTSAPPAANPPPAASASPPASPNAASPAPKTSAPPAANPSPAASATPPASPNAASPAPKTSAPPAANPSPAASATPPASSPAPEEKSAEPRPYSAAWHHRHLFSPRDVNRDSDMPAYRFLYEKRLISGERSADALQLTGPEAPPEGWEIVPTYDANCLVAYLMSLDQSHPLKEVKSSAAAAPAAAASPAASPASSPPPK